MLYGFLKLAAGFVFTKLYKVEVEGLENIPLEGKVILAGNHCSFLDPMVLFYLYPRKFYAVVGKDIYNIRWLKWVFKVTNCIPTNGSSQGAIEALRQEKAVLIFPEGGCSHTGNIEKPRRGAAVLTLKSGAPVIPIAIKGTFEAWPVTQVSPTIFCKIKVRFGKPIYFEKTDLEIIPDNILDFCTKTLIEGIGSLL